MPKIKIKKIFAVVAITLFTLTPVFQAQALFGAGDTTIIIGNIPQQILEGIKTGLASAFAQFASNYLSQMLTKLESNYKIANFLYYSDALVSGQYLQDYMNKYVPNTTDQRMLLAFIPQFSCGQNIDISKQLEQKAIAHLGYDPNQLNPNDPDYNFKLAQLGNFLSSPDGWQIYYQDLAQQAETSANQAAQNEINSPGLKAPRDKNGDIVSSLNSLVQSESAALAASLQLGTSNADSVVGKLASSLTYTFVNKFAFQGAVLKEQATCLTPTAVQPIVPSANPNPVVPSSQSAIFNVNPSAVPSGGTVNLVWDASSIPGVAKVFLGPNEQSVALKGSQTVQITNDTVFSLTLLDANNNTLKIYTAAVSLLPDVQPVGNTVK